MNSITPHSASTKPSPRPGIDWQNETTLPCTTFPQNSASGSIARSGGSVDSLEVIKIKDPRPSHQPPDFDPNHVHTTAHPDLGVLLQECRCPGILQEPQETPASLFNLVQLSSLHQGQGLRTNICIGKKNNFGKTTVSSSWMGDQKIYLQGVNSSCHTCGGKREETVTINPDLSRLATVQTMEAGHSLQEEEEEDGEGEGQGEKYDDEQN